ncbi:MAG: hypothetical protein LBK99_23810 [Opitutaceae bacterium]|jgi:hypothetical protein|nr:hypothetical protein [Opitutaceae bacterium]
MSDVTAEALPETAKAARAGSEGKPAPAPRVWLNPEHVAGIQEEVDDDGVLLGWRVVFKEAKHILFYPGTCTLSLGLPTGQPGEEVLSKPGETGHLLFESTPRDASDPLDKEDRAYLMNLVRKGKCNIGLDTSEEGAGA